MFTFCIAHEPPHACRNPLCVQAGRFDLVSMHWAIGDEQTVQQATASLHHVTGDSHPKRLLVSESDRAQVGQGSVIGSWGQTQGATQMELPAKVGIELGWGESSVRICTAGHQGCAACRTDNQSRLLAMAMYTQPVPSWHQQQAETWAILRCRCTTQLHLPGGGVPQ